MITVLTFSLQIFTVRYSLSFLVHLFANDHAFLQRSWDSFTKDFIDAQRKRKRKSHELPIFFTCSVC